MAFAKVVLMSSSVGLLILFLLYSVYEHPNLPLQLPYTRIMNVGNISSFININNSMQNFMKLNSNGSYVRLEDVETLNAIIHKERQLFVKKYLGSVNNTSTNIPQTKAARELDDDYFQVLAQHPDISTIALYITWQYNLKNTRITWAKGAQPSEILFPRQIHYPFGLERGGCNLFMAKGFNQKRAELIGNDTCTKRESPGESLTPIPVSDKSNIYNQEYTAMLKHWERIYLHIVPNARISQLGVVAQGDRRNNFYIDPLACAPPKRFTEREGIISDHWLKTSTPVDEVFVSIKRWTGGYFHWNIEDVPRLALYLDFLLKNPSIKIILTNKKRAAPYLKILGIGEERLLAGRVRGKIVYLPQGARCGEKTSAYGLTLAMNAYAKYMKDVMKLNQAQDTVILIHRTKRRFLEQHSEIKTMLEQLAKTYEYNFVIFSDKNMPTFENMIKLFNRAVLIVAPHGAGMVNAVFSQPGTVIIEIMCSDRQSVLCYSYMARNMGHIYYGIRHDKYKYRICVKIWVDVSRLRGLANFYLAVKSARNSINAVTNSDIQT